MIKKFFVLFIMLFFPLAGMTKVIERIVAIVNSEIITLSDISEFKQKVKAGGLVDDALMKTVDIEKLKKNEQAVIDYLVNEKIIDSEIKKNSMEVTIERVESEIRKIAKNNGIDRSQLKAALKKQGVDFSEYQDFIKTSLERQSLIEKEVTAKIKISDDEVKEYFLKNNSDAVNNEYYEYSLAHILFLGSNGGINEAKKRALNVIEKLDAGKKFEELASQFSEDPNFTQGGLLGTFKINEMNAKLASSVANLKVGEITPVFAIGSNNFQIVKILKKQVIPNPILDAKAPKIRATLFESAFKKQLSNWLERKRQESFIKINI